MAKCKKCKRNIDPLEVFSGGLCVNCYENQFDQELKKTGIMPKPNFEDIF